MVVEGVRALCYGPSCPTWARVSTRVGTQPPGGVAHGASGQARATSSGGPRRREAEPTEPVGRPGTLVPPAEEAVEQAVAEVGLRTVDVAGHLG